MNEWLCRALRLGREPRARSRQGDELATPWRPGRRSAATATSTTTASPGAPCRASTPRWAPIFTRGTSRDPDARYSEEGPVYVANMERLLNKFETAKALDPGAGRAAGGAAHAARGDLFRLDDAGDARGAAASWPSGGVAPRRPARARLSVRAGGARLHRRPRDGVRRRAEPRRPAARPADQRGRRRSGQADAGAELRRLADHRPLHRRGDRPSRLATAARERAIADDLHHQAPPASSAAADQRPGLHPARLRGQGLDPLRRLRPRLDLGGDHPGRPSNSTCRRTAWPSSPASAARRRRRTISSAPATASTASTAACPACSPAPTSPTAT